ncbi:phosphomethylpyrimidine synthase ThiC [Verrucomicrobiota bacterium]
MSTQLTAAREGEITPAMHAAAAAENTSAENVREQVARGVAVLPANPAHRNLRPIVVGSAFRVKVNANIGRSPECSSMTEECAKLRAALDAGADCVMDLSVGPDLREVRQGILENCVVPLGTVPVYEAMFRVGSDVGNLDGRTLLSVVREHAEAGVDFMTLHAGILREHVPMALRRRMGIVSRGGAVLAEWMARHDRENPFYEAWDDVLAICAAHDITVSLGDALRPGCLADASDQAQFAELSVLGELVQRCRGGGVQVMVEGPGHVPLDQIRMNVEREQATCDGAPFYVLGPVVTDIAPGYDHLASSIGAATAAYHGAALLCYVTPAEHLGLPTAEDVKAGVIAYRIAAHAADVAKGLPGARDVDDEMAAARVAFDWERQFSLAIDPATARERYQRASASLGGESDHCSMCGKELCAMRTMQRLADEK